MDDALLKDVLRTAVYLVRTTRHERWGDTALGISSFDAIAEMMVWDEGFDPLDTHTPYSGETSFPYDRPAGCCRTDSTGTLGKRFWAGYYDSASLYSGELWQYVIPDDAGIARFKDKDVCYAFAAHMLRAKIHTIKAVETLEKRLWQAE